MSVGDFKKKFCRRRSITLEIRTTLLLREWKLTSQINLTEKRRQRLVIIEVDC